MIEIVRRTQQNAKRWRSGEMGLRWTAAGMIEAERQLRRVIGYRELPALLFALEREVDSTEEVAIVAAAGSSRTPVETSTASGTSSQS